MAEYKLPDVGEGLTEAEIVSWKVKVGDVVEINDIVVEIETAKSLVELPSPYAGTVTALLVPEGEMVPVGTPIIAIGDPSEAPRRRARARAGAEDWRRPTPRPRSTSPTRAPAAAARARAWSAATRPTAAPSAAPARAPRPPGVAAGATAAQLQVQGAFEPAGPSPRSRAPTSRRSRRRSARTDHGAAAGRAPGALAKPPVRKLAKDLGVDLATLTRPARRHGHPRGRRAAASRRPAGRRLRRRRRTLARTARPPPASASAASRSRASAR